MFRLMADGFPHRLDVHLADAEFAATRLPCEIRESARVAESSGEGEAHYLAFARPAQVAAFTSTTTMPYFFPVLLATVFAMANT